MNIKNKIREKLRNAMGIGALEAELKRLSTRDLVHAIESRAHAVSAEFIERHMVKAKAMDDAFSVLDFALKQIPVGREGLYCEFGVFRGETINHIARQTKSKVYGFDSFKGLPETWRDGFPAGAFDLTSQGLPQCESNVELVVGWFNETLPGFVSQHRGPLNFLHVDCDLYSSTQTIFAHLGKRLTSGSVVVFNEYFNYPGWQEHEHRAFKEFVDTNGSAFEYLCYNRFHEQVAVRIL